MVEPTADDGQREIAEPTTDDGQQEDGFVTRTSGFDMADIAPERGDFEIGFEDGEGYIEIPVFRDGTTKRFTVPADEVEDYIEQRNDRHPIPTPNVERTPQSPTPEGWEGGEAVNTGGGIFCRIWQKQWDESHVVQVIYQTPESDGISVNVEFNDGSWVGEAHVEIMDEGSIHDTELQPHAHDLIERVDNGEFDDEIESLIEQAP